MMVEERQSLLLSSKIETTNSSVEQHGTVSGDDEFDGSTRGTPVYIHVYDLVSSDINDYLYWIGLGVYHSGVEVYGCEYAYGGHEYDCSGIFCSTNPGLPPSCLGAARDGNNHTTTTSSNQAIMKHRERILVGYTTYGKREVEGILRELGRDEFRGNTYHVLQLNCNRFVEVFCGRLVGDGGVPGWINRLAGVAVSLHCLLPQGWGIPPLLEERGRTAARGSLLGEEC
jgi:hypothetical protein